MTAQQPERGDVAVLVPAAGAGLRLGPGGPKALRSLRGEILLVHAIRRIVSAPCVGCVVVAAPPDSVGLVARTLSPFTQVSVVSGGATRQDSVAAALAAVPDRFGIIMVHDAARSLVPPVLIERVAAAVRAGHPAVVPVLPAVDTFKYVDETGTVAGTVDRESLRAVQTPQGFRREILVAAHSAAIDVHTDDAGLAERIGVPVITVPGEDAALKITRPIDLAIAELLLDREDPTGRAVASAR